MVSSKVWKILSKKFDSDSFGVDDLEKQFLSNRGIKSKKEIEDFFNPDLKKYQKDLQIAGISLAQKRIREAIKKAEQIVIYGDYDVDGVCASAILYKALTALGAKVLPYIPHRENEGYGLSQVGLEFVKDSGASVVITVDNGIVALDQAAYAKELGLDLIITDHHLPLQKKPKAFAIVHSTKMCGAAVAWCLIKEMVKEDLVDELLQFVAIATICDMMGLVDVNRAFVAEGIKRLKTTKNLGLISLALECGISLKDIGSYEIGHIIGPRLNAIGRLEHAIDALRLLCTKKSLKARSLAKLLGEANLKRQKLTDQATEEARILITKNGSKKIHVLQSSDWSPGIIGLIAARVVEEYCRPAIAISVGEMHSKGSARSIAGVNIVEVIRECKDILIDVGGHKGAAGFSIPNENLENFKKRIEKLMDSFKVSGEPVLEIESEVGSKLLTKALVNLIDQFEPFGMGNPKPVLVTMNMRISDIRTLSEGKHLKFKVSPSVILNGAQRSEGSLDCIAFGMGNLAAILKPGQLVDLAFYLEINKFNGKESLQLKIKDIRVD